jgi:disulfide bond formation protein DsbB
MTSNKTKPACPMTALCCKLWGFLSCPFAVMLGLSLISILSLAIAFISEGFLGLEPCILCIYQRWPYVIVAGIGILTLIVKKKAVFVAGLGLNAIAMIANAGIAFYHSGVERKWWASEVEGCKVSFEGDLDATSDAASTTAQSLLENIMSAPTADCSKIPWQDPILGLSMANYNVVMGLGLATICIISMIKTLRSDKSGHSKNV